MSQTAMGNGIMNPNKGTRMKEELQVTPLMDLPNSKLELHQLMNLVVGALLFFPTSGCSRIVIGLLVHTSTVCSGVFRLYMKLYGKHKNTSTED